MALTWNLEKVKDRETVCFGEDDRMRPVTETLIWLTMFFGINQITPKTVDEFNFRCRATELIGETYLIRTDGEARLHFNPSREDIEAHIGLHTNASNYTRAHFMGKVFPRMVEDQIRAKQRLAELDAKEKKEVA